MGRYSDMTGVCSTRGVGRKPEGMRPRVRSENDNIKTIFKETEWNGEHWIYLPQYRIRKRQGIFCRLTIF